MVKVLHLGLFAAIICAFAALTLAVPVSSTIPQNSSVATTPTQPQYQELILSDDGSVRSERSTNLSHITGSARKIQMYVKNRHLQILPDGTVNGTSDDASDYTILQRTTVNIGQLKIQGVATCQYLCMDSCGLLYGSKEFVDECIFNEMIEQHHYNTYSSARYSNNRRTVYLALNRRGQPRKVQVRARHQLGRLSVYARVLTKPVTSERLERLEQNAHGYTNVNAAHPLRHHGGHTCPTAAAANATGAAGAEEVATTAAADDWPSGDRLRCRKRKKRKKKRRRCRDDEADSDACVRRPTSAGVDGKNVRKRVNGENKTKKCEHDSNKNKCQRLEKSELVTIKKKRKQKQLNTFRNVRKKGKKQVKNKKNVKKVLTVLRRPEDATAHMAATAATAVVDSATVASAPHGDDEDYSVAYDNITTTSESVEESMSVDELTTNATDDSEQAYDEVTSSATSLRPFGYAD